MLGKTVFTKSARYLVCLIAVFVALACRTQPISSNPVSSNQKAPATDDFKGDMRDAYKTVAELYSYVWSPAQFYSPSSEARINKLLGRLAKDFHRVESKVPVEAFEPGFRVTLQVHQNLLQDAALRFSRGEKEYVNWRLKGIAANCVSCHSRYEAPADFIGEDIITDNTPEGILARGEFLFASRQFTKANQSFLEAARLFSSTNSAMTYEFTALKLWALNTVRSESNWQKSAKTLQSYIRAKDKPSAFNQKLNSWLQDLKELANEKNKQTSELVEARSLLSTLKDSPSLDEEEYHLIKTLRATSLLHAFLQKQLTLDERRKASYLLAMAYTHLPIVQLEPFKELYIQLVIRDFPHTDEALKAFKLYEQYVTENSGMTGKGGLTEIQTKELIELRRLANPESSPLLNDTNSPG